jgi:DNA polymerase-3 subunit delta'
VGEAEAGPLLDRAGGAPGRAWRLAASGALEVDRAARDLLAALPRTDDVAMATLAEGFRGAAGAARFDLLMNRLADRVGDMASARALAGEGGGAAQGGSLDAWAEAWELLVDLPRAAEAVNLDRADAFFTALSRLRAVAQRVGDADR